MEGLSSSYIIIDSKRGKNRTGSPYNMSLTMDKQTFPVINMYFKSFEGILTIPNINKYNNTLVVNHSTVGQHTMTFNIGMYDLTQFATALSQRLNAVFNPIVFTVTSNITYKTIQISCDVGTFSFVIQPNTLTDTDIFCKFPVGADSVQLIEKCYLYYTRYIVIESKQLQENAEGFYSNNGTISGGIGRVRIENPSSPFLQFIDYNSITPYSSHFHKASINVIYLVLKDEYGFELKDYCSSNEDWCVITFMFTYK